MPRTKAQAKIAVTHGAEASLLRLPVETRLQIYGIVLLADFSSDDKGRASDKPDDAVDDDEVDSDTDSEESYNEGWRPSRPDYWHDDRRNSLPSRQQPTYDNRQEYGQLLLACKMIHAEAAPLFYGGVTFFVKEPFKFANTFLIMLPAYKITSIRHLEMRLSFGDFKYANWKVRSKVLNDLITVFKAYRELSHLDSLTLTIRGRLLGDRKWKQLVLCPFKANETWYTYENIMGCMSEAGRAIADTIAIAGFDILEDVEDIFGEETRAAIAKVKVQRKE